MELKSESESLNVIVTELLMRYRESATKKVAAEWDEDEWKQRSKVSVCRFTHDGITYLRSSENLLYDINTKEECGLWDEKTSTIKEIQDDSEDEVEDEDECEMSADEYDSDA